MGRSGGIQQEKPIEASGDKLKIPIVSTSGGRPLGGWGVQPESNHNGLGAGLPARLDSTWLTTTCSSLNFTCRPDKWVRGGWWSRWRDNLMRPGAVQSGRRATHHPALPPRRSPTRPSSHSPRTFIARPPYLPRQADPHARLLLHKSQQAVRLDGASIFERLGARWGAFGPQPELREILAIDSKTLGEVGIILVAVFRDAHVTAQQRGGGLADGLGKVFPRVMLRVESDSVSCALYQPS